MTNLESTIPEGPFVEVFLAGHRTEINALMCVSDQTCAGMRAVGRSFDPETGGLGC